MFIYITGNYFLFLSIIQETTAYSHTGYMKIISLFTFIKRNYLFLYVYNSNEAVHLPVLQIFISFFNLYYMKINIVFMCVLRN